jgi:hypothetical protein
MLAVLNQERTPLKRTTPTACAPTQLRPIADALGRAYGIELLEVQPDTRSESQHVAYFQYGPDFRDVARRQNALTALFSFPAELVTHVPKGQPWQICLKPQFLECKEETCQGMKKFGFQHHRKGAQSQTIFRSGAIKTDQTKLTIKSIEHGVRVEKAANACEWVAAQIETRERRMNNAKAGAEQQKKQGGTSTAKAYAQAARSAEMAKAAREAAFKKEQYTIYNN